MTPSDLPTHNADGKRVLAFDNGASRPTVPGDGAAPVTTTSVLAAQERARQTLQDLIGQSDTPLLVLPAGIRFDSVMVLSRIADRAVAFDKADVNGHGNDVADWLAAIDNALTDAGHKVDDENLIERLIDTAAITVAAIEALQRTLDTIRKTPVLANGGDSTGLAAADNRLADAAAFDPVSAYAKAANQQNATDIDTRILQSAEAPTFTRDEVAAVTEQSEV